MTIDQLRNNGWIIYECVSGSKAYGLDVPGSDTDIRGVFLLPKAQFYGLNYLPQVADATNNEVFYELGRYIELLAKNNPNILELLATPPDKVVYKHPLLDRLQPAQFLSKRCKDTFGGYAFTQIRKAKGLNKKINKPLPREKKQILDFCYVLEGQGSKPLRSWLESQKLDQSQCGLINVPHAKDIYALFVDPTGELGYRGIQRKPDATKVVLSSIPKSATCVAYLVYNENGYQTYCRDYREYWEWVDNRNPVRYATNVNHGRNYDSKNMMHTFRLLDTAIEILVTGQLHVQRPNREELLAIRRGEFEYDDLINRAEAKMAAVEAAYAVSSLPDEPDRAAVEALLVELREAFYEEKDLFSHRV